MCKRKVSGRVNHQPLPSEAVGLILDQIFPGLPEDERAALKQSYAYLAQWVARLPRGLPYEEESSHLFAARETDR